MTKKTAKKKKPKLIHWITVAPRRQREGVAGCGKVLTMTSERTRNQALVTCRKCQQSLS